MLILELYIFVLAGFVGYMVITRVPPLLHTPLMSATNAISGISLVGSLVAAGSHRGTVATILGFIAVVCATTNIVGGFLITDRMLKMFKRDEPKAKTPSGEQVDDARAHHASSATSSPSVLFILGLRSLTRPDKARQGMQMAAVGMLFAICGTLINHEIVDYRWIAGGLVLGAIIGYPLGMWVPTTALPQRIAMSLSFGALASVLVGVSEYYHAFHGGGEPLEIVRGWRRSDSRCSSDRSP